MVKFEINWMEDGSDEALLAEIRRVAALVPSGRLVRRVFNSLSKISSATIERRFGSWSEATRRAGLTDALPDYSDAAILDDLRRVSESFPEDPFTNKFYATHGGRYEISAFKRRLGGWREALDAAGIGSRYVGPPTTERMRSQPGRALGNEEILAQIRDIYKRLGRPLSFADIAANSEINQAQLFRRFGSFTQALRQAGVEQGNLGRRYTEDQVFENLLNVWTHYGRPPTHSEMDNPPSTVGHFTYIKRYGGWRKALTAFVDRVSSEMAGDPAPAPEQGPSRLADHAKPTERPTTAATGYEPTQPISQISSRPHRVRNTQANVKPQDRRDPGYALKHKVFVRDNCRCQYCGKSPATDLGCRLEVDHIVPFSKGGKTTYENLQLLCSRCNLGKSNK